VYVATLGSTSDTVSSACSTDWGSIRRRCAARSASVRRSCEDHSPSFAECQARIADDESSSTTSLRNADVSRYQTKWAQRSERRSSRTSPVFREDFTGSGNSVEGRRAGCTRPEATRALAPVAAEGGVNTATSLPLSVTPSVSPRSTRRRAADACCWSSLTPMVSMCVKCSTTSDNITRAEKGPVLRLYSCGFEFETPSANVNRGLPVLPTPANNWLWVTAYESPCGEGTAG
jgi:hypothetical protein